MNNKIQKQDKSIELTSSQVKALKDGASMLIMPIRVIDNEVEYEITVKNNVVYGLFDDGVRIKKIKQPMKDFIKQESSLQKDNKDIFVKEEFFINGLDECVFKADFTDIADKTLFENTISKMTKEQSRFIIKEVLDVKVLRVQDLTLDECYKISGISDYRYCYNFLSEYIPHSRADLEIENPYLFLYEIKIEDRLDENNSRNKRK